MQVRATLQPVTLAPNERAQLERWASDDQSGRGLAMRARIVLSCQAGLSNRESAQRLHTSARTVGKWRARFLIHGIQGLSDRPRSGAPRTVDDAVVEALLARTLHEKAPDGGLWSSRRLATTLGVSQRTVLRIWRIFEL
jgi:transposase